MQEILKVNSERHEQHLSSLLNGHQIPLPNLVTSDEDGGDHSVHTQEQPQNSTESQAQPVGEPKSAPQQPESEVDAQQQRQLLSKVIELENKATINAKREVRLVLIFINGVVVGMKDVLFFARMMHYSESVLCPYLHSSYSVGRNESPAVGDRGQELEDAERSRKAARPE